MISCGSRFPIGDRLGFLHGRYYLMLISDLALRLGPFYTCKTSVSSQRDVLETQDWRSGIQAPPSMASCCFRIKLASWPCLQGLERLALVLQMDCGNEEVTLGLYTRLKAETCLFVCLFLISNRLLDLRILCLWKEPAHLYKPQSFILIYCDFVAFFAVCVRGSYFPVFTSLAEQHGPWTAARCCPAASGRFHSKYCQLCIQRGPEIKILFMPRIPRSLDPQTLQTHFWALPSLAAEAFAWLMSGGVSCCGKKKKKRDRTASFWNGNWRMFSRWEKKK